MAKAKRKRSKFKSKTTTKTQQLKKINQFDINYVLSTDRRMLSPQGRKLKKEILKSGIQVKNGQLQRQIKKQRPQRKRSDLLLERIKKEAYRRATPKVVSDTVRFTKLFRVCNRRVRVRASLFAKEIIGKGKGGSGKPRKITEDSKIKC